MKITHRQAIILKALSYFKFLTSNQLEQVLNCSLSTINGALRGLKTFRYPLVKSVDFGVAPGKGRLAPVHHLTEAWKRVLITDLRVHPNQIKIPSKGSSFFQSDYHHRIATIQFNIQFQQWVAKKGYRLLLVNTYFNRKYIDGGYLSETRVIHHGKRTEPDAIGVYGDDHRFYTFLFEQHNGMDAKRAIEQINNHCNLLGNSGYTYQIGKRSPVRVAYVFQHSCCMQSVMKKMMESPALRLFKHSFLFKTEEELQQWFEGKWHHPDGTTTDFYPGR